jgi:hypothetical protein
LVEPVPIDPAGTGGPTAGQARGPSWRRTSRGLYVPTSVTREVVEQRILEESRRLPEFGAVSGWAALRFHGVAYCDGLDRRGNELPVPLVVPPGTPMRGHPGILVHRERLDRGDVTVVLGVPCTRPARAAFDAARRASGLREAVVALDVALAVGVITPESFGDHLRTRSRWPGVRQASRALDLADARSMSPMETRLRLIWRIDARLPPPLSNWPVADAAGEFIGRPDLLSDELAVVGEFDGAEHRSRGRQRDDVRRDELFRRAGLEPFRVVGADLDDVPLVVDRIRAAIRRAGSSATPRTWRTRRDPGPLV